MYQVTVTIGRNVDNSFMPIVEWAKFQDDVAGILEELSNFNCEPEIHIGTGTWNGVVEESAKISILVDSAPVDIVTLKKNIETLRDKYKQDAIALCIGNSELI